MLKNGKLRNALVPYIGSNSYLEILDAEVEPIFEELDHGY
jgi:hypothetical protein